MSKPAADEASDRNRAGSYALLGFLSVMWGLAFVAIREVDLQMSFVNFTVLRWLVASAGYLALAPFVGRPKVQFERRDVPRFLVVAFLNVAAYHLSLNYAEESISAGLAGLLVSLGPVFSAVLSVIFLREKVGGRLLAALLLAVAGTAVISAQSLGQGEGSLSGPLAVVLAAFCYAAFGVLSKPLVEKYGGLAIAAWAGVIGTVMLLPLLSGSMLAQAAAMSPGGWASLLYLSLVSTVVGYSIFFTLVGKGGVSTLYIQLYLVPLVSVLGGVLLLGESVTYFMLAGGAGLLASVWLATSSGRR